LTLQTAQLPSKLTFHVTACVEHKSQALTSSACRLFNNPALSDVTIKQIYVDQVREYHAHKAVLCMESEYFLNMFTGKFKVRSR
jgi:hypothetical protein